MRILPFLLLPLVLAGCIATGESLRYVVEPALEASTPRVRTSVGSISIVEVSLPEYAKDTKIFVEEGDNALADLENADWGDEPERAFANALVGELTLITGAEVATDPWPLGGVPEAEVRVRVSHMVVRRDGTVSLAGHFSIRRDLAESRNKVELFAVSVPVTATGAEGITPADVLRAHAASWRELASEIARAL